jgi:hypothetical protein
MIMVQIEYASLAIAEASPFGLTFSLSQATGSQNTPTLFDNFLSKKTFFTLRT